MRNRPGVLSHANSAASMARVPEPHMGTTKGLFLSHQVAIIVPAAKASSIGALPGILR